MKESNTDYRGLLSTNQRAMISGSYFHKVNYLIYKILKNKLLNLHKSFLSSGFQEKKI